MSKQCPTCGRRYADPLIFCADDGTQLGDDPLIGRRVAGREILRFIGEGGAGALYLAEHLELQRDEALKLLHPSYAREPQFVNRFLQEARIIAKLKSPHTVRLFDFGRTHDGLVFILMEFLRGQTLQAMLQEEPKMAPRRAAEIITQICDSLAEAHAAEVIHRDIKPANVMVELIGEAPHARMLDFGVARARGPDACHTVPGQFVGTPAFSSPEQALGEAHIDGRSDLYTLGILFYTMLAGYNPYEVEGNWIETLKRQAGWTPPPLDDAPPLITSLISELLDKHPQGRPASAEVVARRLQAYLQPTPTIITRPPPLSDEAARLNALRAAVAEERAELAGLSAELEPRLEALRDQEEALSACAAEAAAAAAAATAKAEAAEARWREVTAGHEALRRRERGLIRQGEGLDGHLSEVEARLEAAARAHLALNEESQAEWARMSAFQADLITLRGDFEALFLRAEAVWDRFNEEAATRFQISAGLKEGVDTLRALREDLAALRERHARRRQALLEPASSGEAPGPARPVTPPPLDTPLILPETRRVEGAAPYEIAAAPLTVGLRAALMGGEVSEAGAPQRGVSFFDALEIANALSTRLGLRPCYAFEGERPRWDTTADGWRLPTEAEWAAAAAAGAVELEGGLWIWCWDPWSEATSAFSRAQRGEAGQRRAKPAGLRHHSFGLWLARG
ncbi:serine/threonine protein kinase [Myxococcota bacterium]|nr:serine/threonine protein kinase [Myxococcota bacterium]